MPPPPPRIAVGQQYEKEGQVDLIPTIKGLESELKKGKTASHFCTAFDACCAN